MDILDGYRDILFCFKKTILLNYCIKFELAQLIKLIGIVNMYRIIWNDLKQAVLQCYLQDFF